MQTEPRSQKDVPYCWQAKEARRIIRDAADGFPRQVTAAAALGVYDSLTEVASDGQSEQFSSAQDWIALKAGLTRKTVQRVLPILRELGLVSYSEPKGMRIRTVYTLLALGPRDSTKGPSVSTLGPSDIHSTGPRYEESPKNLLKELEEESSAPAPAVAVAHSPKTRKRDEAFEALVRIQGASLAALTPTERGSINKALKDIRTVAPDVTAAMLDTAAMRWRRKYPTSSPTAMTLAKHWSELTAGITAESTSIDPDRQARARAQIVSLQHDLDGIRALPVCDDSEAMAARREKAAELQGKINALRPVAGMPAR